MDFGTDALRKAAVAPTEKCVGRCKFEPVLSAVEEFVVAHNGLPQGGDGKYHMLARDWKLLVLYVRSNPYCRLDRNLWSRGNLNSNFFVLPLWRLRMKET